MATAIPFGDVPQVYDNGSPVSGGKVYFYVPGTSTPRTPYSDTALSVPTTNPVLLNAAGWPATNVYLDSSLSYDYIIKSADDSETLWPRTTIPANIEGAQPVDATLTAWAGATIVNGSIIIGTGTDTIRVDSVTSFRTLVATVAAMKALNTTNLVDGQVIETQGYFAASDGGGATYKYTAGGAGSANTYTTIDATDAGGYFTLVPDAEGIDVRQIGLLPNTRTLAQARLNARAIEGYAALANGIALTDHHSDNDDVFWLAPPAALTNGASVGQTGCVKLTSALTIKGSRSGAWFRQYDDQFCALFALYPGADFYAESCRFDQWLYDRGDGDSNANYASGVTVTDTTLTGTGSNSVTAIYLGCIHGFGGDYHAEHCEYTNANYGDIVPDARSRGNVMESVHGFHHDTYSCVHSLGDVATEYNADATAKIYERVIVDHIEMEDVLTEPVDIGGGVLFFSCRPWSCKNGYTFSANPSHKEIFDIQDVRYFIVSDGFADLNKTCGTMIRIKGGKNSGGIISNNVGRDGLKNAIEVTSIADNGSGKLRVNLNSAHGATTGDTWVLMGSQTSTFSASDTITVIDTDTFDMTGVTYAGSEVASRGELRAVPAPIELVSSATGDYTLDAGVAFSTTELQWAGSAGTIVAKQTAHTANGSFDLGDAEASAPLDSYTYLMTVTVTGMTTGQLIVSIAGSADYGLPGSSSDPITANGTYTFLMASNGVNEIAYVGTSNFDGNVEVTDCSMIEWEGAFIVHSNSENYIIENNVGTFFFDGLHSLDQGNRVNRDGAVKGNRVSGILNDAIIATHYTNYADLGAVFDKRIVYENNHFRDVYRNAINLSGTDDATISGGSFHMIGNGACPTVFNSGCSDIILHSVRFFNGVSLSFDTNLTDETIEFIDCPGFVGEVRGRFDSTLSAGGKAVISRTAFTYTPVDATEARKSCQATATLAGAAFTAAGNNPFAIHHDFTNLENNTDVRFLCLDELGAVANAKAAKFNWVLRGPTKFPVP